MVRRLIDHGSAIGDRVARTGSQGQPVFAIGGLPDS